VKHAAGGVLLLCGMLAAPNPAVPATAVTSDPFPAVASAYLLKIDGKAVWEHHPDRRLPVASLTKMMTALLVLEEGRLGETATVGDAAAGETGTCIGLKPGEKMRVADLLAAMLLGSANDAAHVLADHLAGTEKRFVRRMNARAAALGMRNTRFANATGHHHQELYSTARDLALLAEKTMADARFAALAAKVRLEVRTADGSRTFQLENRNEMVGRYRGAVGVKTGYTREAGPCLVAFARRDGTRVLLVLLNAPNRWWDAVDMMDRAFSRTGEARADGTP
jgi:D-alanyl-D-alanine carboxypeptidase (penicillin-binding protein 5/6)